MNNITYLNKNSRVRTIKHYTRLNLLKLKGFDFSNSSFLTLTIANSGIASNMKKVHNAKSKLIKHLKRKGLRYYVSVSEYQERGVLHYHLILFNVPYLDIDKDIKRFWRLGFVKINMIKSYNKDGAFYYLLSYISKKKNQKHLRLVWSRSFQKDGWFSFSSSIYVYATKNKESIIDFPNFDPSIFVVPGASSYWERKIFRYRYRVYALNCLMRYNFYLYSEEVYNHFMFLLERYAFNFLC